MTTLKVLYRSSPKRIVVDPNSFSRRNPAWSVASVEDCSSSPSPGEMVLAVQPDEDGFEGIAWGTVVDVDDEQKIVRIAVDWDTFSVSRSPDRQAQHHDAAGLAKLSQIGNSWPINGGTTTNANPVVAHAS